MRNQLWIMLALLKKNNAQPGFFTTLLVLGLTFVLSLVDSISTFPAEGWFLVLFWLLVLAASAGAGAFSSDLKNDHIRFLEYLPIRRWHIWLADYGDGLAWIGLFIVASLWYRVLHWTPPAWANGYGDPMAWALLPRPWTLPLGAAAVAFCSFSVAAYTRLAIERDSTAIFRSFVDAMAALGIVMAVPAMLRVFPGLADVTLVVLVIGLLYTAAGFITFMYTPREWGRFKRWILIRVPMLIVLNLSTVSLVLMLCPRWARLDPSEPLAIAFRDDSRIGADVLVELESRRSGSHLIRLNPLTGQQSLLGRGLEPWYERDVSDSDHFMLSGSFLFDQILPMSTPTLSVLESDGQVRRTGLAAGNFKHGGHEYYTRRLVWSDDGQQAIFCAESLSASGVAFLFIADRDGRIQRSIPIAPGFGFHKGPGGRFLCVASNPYTEGSNAVRYFIYDLASGKQQDLLLPGVLVSCNPRMTQGVCISSSVTPQGLRQSVELVDLSTLETRTLIEPGEMPAWTVSYMPGMPSTFPADGVLTPQFDKLIVSENLRLQFDQQQRQLVWFGLQPGPRPTALHWLDLQTGQRRILLDESGTQALMARARGDYQPMIVVKGFTPSGDGLIYHLGREIVRLSIADGSRSVMARTPEQSDYVAWIFSPDRRRTLASYRTRPADRAGAGERSVIEAWDQGRVTRLHDAARAAQGSWYDDDHVLLVTERQALSIVRFDGTARRQLLGRVQD